MIHDALMEETIACKQAPEAAECFGIIQIEVETGSCHLKGALTSQAKDLAFGGNIFRFLHAYLFNHFRCLTICNVPRSCNSSAHELARKGLSWDPGQSNVWTDPLPEFVPGLAARDYAERVPQYKAAEPS